jgi:hypothetical protein
MVSNKILLTLPGEFFGLTPPQMLLAGGILLLLGVLSAISKWGDKGLTRTIGVVGILAILTGCCWVLFSIQTEPEPISPITEKQGEIEVSAPKKAEKFGEPRSKSKPSVDKQPSGIFFAGKFEDHTGRGIPDAEVRINNQSIGVTDKFGQFRVALPISLYGYDAAVLECRKLGSNGALSGQTTIDPGYSNENLRIQL